MKLTRFGLAMRAPLLAVVAAFAVAGCGATDDGPELAPAAGRVTVDGSPLQSAGISFRADATKGNTTQHLPAATSDADGKYVLTTVNRPGAPPGWYKVVVIAGSPPPAGGEMPKAAQLPFDKKYTDVETTDLSIEVKADAPPETSYDLKLTK